MGFLINAHLETNIIIMGDDLDDLLDKIEGEFSEKPKLKKNPAASSRRQPTRQAHTE